jgi:hypothetical protein
MKCDFCDNQYVAYGAYQCYFACEEHIAKGDAIESKMFDSMKDENEMYRITVANVMGELKEATTEYSKSCNLPPSYDEQSNSDWRKDKSDSELLDLKREEMEHNSKLLNDTANMFTYEDHIHSVKFLKQT